MNSYVLPTYPEKKVSFKSGFGCWLKADDGSEFLDLGGGIAVNILGHAHPKLVSALVTQANKVWHTSNLYGIPNQEELAEILCKNS